MVAASDDVGDTIPIGLLTGGDALNGAAVRPPEIEVGSGSGRYVGLEAAGCSAGTAGRSGVDPWIGSWDT